jgi:nucleoid DNA-binding protein
MIKSVSELAERLAERDLGGKQQIRNIIAGLIEEVASEVDKGENVTIPGLLKINWRYSAARKKGEMYRKGEERTGFGGVVSIAEEDSPARKQSIKLGVSFLGNLNKVKKSDDAQKRAIKKAKK